MEKLLKAGRPHRREPTHPGEIMREAIEDYWRLPIAEVARRMGVSRQSLHEVLRGEARLTPEMALRFEALGGGTPELLLRLQANYDVWHARQKLKAEVARVEPVRETAD